jgi:hypothetical protein
MICIAIKKHIAARREKFMINANRNEFNSTEKRRTYRLMLFSLTRAQIYIFYVYHGSLLINFEITANDFRFLVSVLFGNVEKY